MGLLEATLASAVHISYLQRGCLCVAICSLQGHFMVSESEQNKYNIFKINKKQKIPISRQKLKMTLNGRRSLVQGGNDEGEK